MKLQGRVAVVTGGASGIGRASALLFAQEGASTAVVDRDAASAKATVCAIVDQGGTAAAVVVDVGNVNAGQQIVTEVVQRWDRIDILMTAAGISCGGTVETTSVEDWDNVFRVNVGGTWLIAKSVIPLMRQGGGGSIVTISSQLALAGGRCSSAYIAAKGAILSLTRTMALDFAADGIRVNAIAPGAIDTPMLARSFARQADAQAAREHARLRHALARFGKPEEIAKAALYLASDDASFVTGSVLVIDGGWLAA
jgi:2-keto-3-deoxy-L-fuconate dehydrogenase